MASITFVRFEALIFARVLLLRQAEVMRLVGALALAVGILMTSATARSDRTVTIGAGTQTCAVFTAHYKGRIQSLENFYFSWAQG
jgi:hypothetical protein